MKNNNIQNTVFRFVVFFLITFLSVDLRAESEVIDFMRNSGKIYSVVAVVAVIFIGLAIYLFRLDAKLTKLEKRINDQ
ncbi:MAG: CcmD family protein [Saprospiraceae bacterium]|nr:MAG: hypothetical protein UZ09_BCD002001166 [Bacteroidetes bacterium OLB9]MCO6464431.1 CcmD family protein [Saprospiraceae bacterium]MCZ2336597.1 CcmD family protein [Chitinophagales bacterium]